MIRKYFVCEITLLFCSLILMAIYYLNPNYYLPNEGFRYFLQQNYKYNKNLNIKFILEIINWNMDDDYSLFPIPIFDINKEEVEEIKSHFKVSDNWYKEIIVNNIDANSIIKDVIE
jgi:hypothetical protein